MLVEHVGVTFLFWLQNIGYAIGLHLALGNLTCKSTVIGA